MSSSGSIAQLLSAFGLENCDNDTAMLSSRLNKGNLSFFKSLGSGNEAYSLFLQEYVEEVFVRVTSSSNSKKGEPAGTIS